MYICDTSLWSVKCCSRIAFIVLWYVLHLSPVGVQYRRKICKVCLGRKLSGSNHPKTRRVFLRSTCSTRTGYIILLLYLSSRIWNYFLPVDSETHTIPTADTPITAHVCFFFIYCKHARTSAIRRRRYIYIVTIIIIYRWVVQTHTEIR